ncbi:MAG: HD domain-containing protein [Clostridia bacterium]|nr:HD domain-containing protein [Clostridia bacterium]
MVLPDYAEKAIALLNESGFACYAVGGWVRDGLLQSASHDIDLTTSATPEEMQRVFSSYSVIATGLQHGTLTVLLDGHPLEITTFRTESAYSDGRHPDAIRFARDLNSDLSRRDFTVNAMAFHPREGVVDPFGGQQDLQNSVLRCVGNAAERFTEDALRILRLLRFASKLGFSVESQTKKAAFECKERLLLLSKERIAVEFKGILCGAFVKDVLLEYHEILAVLFPFISKMYGFAQHNFHHCFDVYEHTATVVAAAPDTPVLRLAAFFHDCGKPDCFTTDENGIGHFYAHASRSAQIAKETMQSLKLDKKTTERVTLLVKLHDSPIEEDARAIKRRLNKYGEAALLELIALQRADTLGLAPAFHTRLAHFDALESLTGEVVASGAVFSLRDLAVNGNDMKRLGLRGKEIGSALKKLLCAVLDEKVKNEKAALLEYLKLHP